MSQISNTSVSTVLPRSPKRIKVRVLNPRGQGGLTSQRAAQALVDRGQARWEGAAIRIIEDDGQPPAGGSVRGKPSRARHRPRFQFAPYVPPPAYEPAVVGISLDWLANQGYELFGKKSDKRFR
jgi:hypothetical protein